MVAASLHMLQTVGGTYVQASLPAARLLHRRGGCDWHRPGVSARAAGCSLTCSLCTCPQVNYCQGMAFVAGIILMYLPEEPAFRMLARLLDERGPNLRRLYLPGLEVGLQSATAQRVDVSKCMLPCSAFQLCVRRHHRLHDSNRRAIYRCRAPIADTTLDADVLCRRSCPRPLVLSTGAEAAAAGAGVADGAAFPSSRRPPAGARHVLHVKVASGQRCKSEAMESVYRVSHVPGCCSPMLTPGSPVDFGSLRLSLQI